MTTATVNAATRSSSLLERLRPWIGPVVAVVIVAISIVVLHRLSAEITWHAVKSDIAGLPWHTLAIALVATFVSYLAFSLYDVFALQAAAPGKVPRPVAVFAGACGYAVSNLLGFSYLTGPAVRTRIYSAYKIDLALIASVITSIWVFFWTGILLLFGVMLLVHPQGVAAVAALTPGIQKFAGAAFLAVILAFFVWLSRKPRVFKFRSVSIPLPGLRLALLQTLIGMIDIAGSSLALFVLLPSDLATNFPSFFVIYVAAVALGIASHTPGGVGVFETTLLAGLGATGRADALAALVVFRVIYYVLPFALAAAGLAIGWGATNRKAVGASGRKLHGMIGTMVPAVAAGLAFVTGLILLISGSLPGETGRLAELENFVPLFLIEISHLAGSILGVLLIVVAFGLYRRQYRAWLLAMGLLLAGAILSLSKGFDWEEAAALIFSLFVLWQFRQAFYRAAGQSVFILSPRWILVSAAVLGFSIWVGLFAYSHVEYSNELWWRFAWNGDAPRFLRASLAAGLVLAAIGINSLISASTVRLPAEAIPDAVRGIITLSTNAEAAIHLTGDKRFLVSDNEKAFIGYADSGHTLIAKGDPIGDPKAGRELIWKLRELADRLGKNCAFYAVWQDYLPSYLDLGCSILKIGEIARVDLPAFSLDGPKKKDLRYARSRAARDSYRFEIIPHADLPPMMDELRRVSDAWLAMKQGDEKAFALGHFDPDYLANFDHAVLRHSETGQITAFANMLQSAGHNELSVDLMRHDPEGPAVAMDALFAETMLWGQAQGYRWFSLGAAPFSGMQSRHLATTWNRIGNFVYQHGGQFYHFEGLRSFKEKFEPVWTPNYLAIPRATSAPQVLLEVNGLISGGVRGLLR